MNMLTKKHFERMAQLLAGSDDELIDEFCNWLSEENPRFDQIRFKQRIVDLRNKNQIWGGKLVGTKTPLKAVTEQSVNPPAPKGVYLNV